MSAVGSAPETPVASEIMRPLTEPGIGELPRRVGWATSEARGHASTPPLHESAGVYESNTRTLHVGVKPAGSSGSEWL